MRHPIEFDEAAIFALVDPELSVDTNNLIVIMRLSYEYPLVPIMILTEI